MKFGKYLSENAVAKWRLYYLDYTRLKDLIKDHTKHGKVHRSNKQFEAEFLAAIEVELDKVNDFFCMTERQLSMKLDSFKTLVSHEHFTISTPEALYDEMDFCAQSLNDLAQYTRVNFTGFGKIMKKHDRHTGLIGMPWFMLRLKEQPFHTNSRQFSRLLIKFSDACSACRKALGAHEQSVDVEEGGFQGFQRDTTKYWVKLSDVMAVKTFIARHLPVYIYTSDFGRSLKEEDKTDAALISSCYYDNPESFSCYQSRIRKDEGAIAIRFRVYENSKEVFVERKTHHQNWVMENSIKERFDLNEPDVYDFVRGNYTVEDYNSHLQQRGKSAAEREAACKLFESVHEQISELSLRPSVTTVYRRTAFQIAGDARVRISLDTDLAMVKELLKFTKEPPRWKRDPASVPERDIHEFPYAVLEVKLQTHKGVEPPEWVQKLVEGPLVQKAEHFSKFGHGTAVLFNNRAPLLPKWWPQFELDHAKLIRFANGEDISDEDDDAKKPEKGVNAFMDDLEPEDEGEMLDYADGDLLVPMQDLSSGGKRKYRPVGAAKKSVSLWQRINNAWNFAYHESGKPIVVDMKIEPKTYFANERTFIQWISFCVVIQAIGIALISYPSKHLFGVIAGVLFIMMSLLFMIYSILMFRWRAVRIANQQPGRYDDKWGPLALVSVLGAAVLVNLAFFAYERISPEEI